MSTEAAPRRRAPAKKRSPASGSRKEPAQSQKRAKKAARRQAAPEIVRRLPVGAEVLPQGVHFRVWAPLRKAMEVVFEGPSGSWPVSLALSPEGGGYFSGLVEGAGAGALYRFRLDGALYPDPASRFQPQGPHGPSQVVDPSS